MTSFKLSTRSRKNYNSRFAPMDVVVDIVRHPKEKEPGMCITKDSKGYHYLSMIFDPGLDLNADHLRWIANTLDKFNNRKGKQ